MRILVYRIGQLGDTVVALPALWSIRKYFPDANVTLLCDRHPGTNYALASDLLRGTPLCDDFLSYDVDPSSTGRLRKHWGALRLLTTIRAKRFDAMIYLAPSNRTPAQIARDRRFFSLAGIRTIIGMHGFPKLPEKLPGQELASTPSEADLLLERLARDGIPVPPPGFGSLDLCLGDGDLRELEQWENALGSDDNRVWVAVGPGSKMPSKKWPLDRFETVVATLIERHNIWPVVFGGAEDRSDASLLLKRWGRGHNAAGSLSLRAATAGLRKCAFYLGNDTGTMHLAAVARIPCVVIFSSRAQPGLWYPYGTQSVVFRTRIDCEGCELVECEERKNECLQRITSSEVLNACESFFDASKDGRHLKKRVGAGEAFA